MAVTYTGPVYTASGNIVAAADLHIPSVVVASGSNQMLLVFSIVHGSAGTGSFSACKWNGQTLTHYTGASFNDNVNAIVDVWYLLDAGLSAATADVLLTVGVAANQQQIGMCFLLGGVNQGSPIGGNVHSAPTGSVNLLSGSITAAVGDLLVDFYDWGNNPAQSLGQTPNGGQTSPTGAIYSPFTSETALSSYKAGTGSSTTMGWTLTANESGTYVVIDVQAAAITPQCGSSLYIMG